MALWKRIAFWLFVLLVPVLTVVAILVFSIDRSIKIHPGIARDIFEQCRTLPEVEAFVGGPPGDYTTVPYSFGAPDATAEKTKDIDRFIEASAGMDDAGSVTTAASWFPWTPAEELTAQAR
jgi:hypothetical protein